MSFDPRVTPVRADLAAEHLKGKVEAARYVNGEPRVVIETSAPLRRAPRHDAPLDTEALHGERVNVYDIDGEGWAWGQIERDGYVGYLPANALVDAGQYEAAMQESAEAKRLSPLQTLSDTYGAIALARLGRTNEARAVLDSLTATARQTYVPPSHFAMIEAALGNRDQAFAYLDAALSVRDARLSMLKVDPKWDALRSDPRFAAALRRMNF